jgi:hypothetical protein
MLTYKCKELAIIPVLQKQIILLSQVMKSSEHNKLINKTNIDTIYAKN